MKPKRELSAKEIVEDVRAGMSDQDLMDKHRLTSKGLQSVFRKLMAAQYLNENELSERMPILADDEEVTHSRRLPRHYPFVRIPIYDLDNLTIDGYHIRDLSERGIQVSGIEVGVGTRKTFLVQVDEYVDILPLHFEAECKWVQPATENAPQLAGFEIAYITNDGLVELRKLIELITFQS